MRVLQLPFFISCYLVAATSAAVVLITAASAVVALIDADTVVAGKNKDKDDEKNPVAVASVTKEHFVAPLSHLPLHNTRMGERCA